MKDQPGINKELHNMMETTPNARTHKITLVDGMVLIKKFNKIPATLVAICCSDRYSCRTHNLVCTEIYQCSNLCQNNENKQNMRESDDDDDGII